MNEHKNRHSTRQRLFHHPRARVVLAVSSIILLVAGTLSLHLFTTHAIAPPTLIPLPNSVPSQVAGAKLIGHHSASTNNASTTMTIGLILSPSNQTEMASLSKGLYNPHSSLYHHWLQTGEFDKLFGPTSSQIVAISNFLRQAGLHAVPGSPDSLIVLAAGTSSQIEMAFHTSINDYQSPDGTTFFANSTSVQIPSNLNGVIGGVIGLTNIPSAKPLYTMANKHKLLGRTTSPQYGAGPKGSGLTPSQIAGIYDANPVYNTLHDKGTGKVLGLFELAGYTRSDIGKYEKQFGLPNVPIQDKPISPAKLSHIGAGEVELDIEMQIALAPGVSKILVYNAPNDQMDGVLEYNRIAFDNIADAVSTSWGLCEASALSSTITGESLAFTKMMMQGQSIFAASGDSGAFGCPGSSSLQVQDPASQPDITAVGGTSFAGGFLGFGGFDPGSNKNPTYPTGKESAWNGSGGGVSQVWAMPNYQAGPGVNESSYSQSGSWCKQSSGTPCREVPDVSINADKYSGYSVYCTDTTDCKSFGWVAFGGTSAGAPLWAAFTVLGDSYYKQRLGFLNPFLYTLDSTNSYSTAFHDIINGNNNQGLFSPGYPAGTNYDMVTGLGTPDIYQLVHLFSSSIQVSPNSVSLTAPSGVQPSSQNLTLTNNGTGTLSWSVSWSDSPSPSWVTASPTSGSLIAGTSQQLTLTFNITSTTSQTYSTNLIISDAHAKNSPVSIPVTVFVPSPGAIVTLPTNGQDACTTNSLPANDDNSSAAIALPFTPNFFGYTYNSVFVNNNGYVTFDAPTGDYTPYPLASTSHAIIAPFFADVDTRGTGSNLVTYGSGTYEGHAAFCVDWVSVGYYYLHTDKLNSFQLLLVDRSDRNPGSFDIVMNYNQIQWETGDASGGSQGLGGTSARVGYSNGNGTSFELPDSGVNGALLDSNIPGGLIYGSQNDSQPGRYIYAV